jgi:hypothetical protein
VLAFGAQAHGLDFARHNFVHLDRSGPRFLAASLQTILDQVGRTSPPIGV